MNVTAWDDPIITEHGYHPDGPYLTEAWSAVIGATCVTVYQLLHRRIGGRATVGEIAALVAVQPSKARSVLNRLERFGLIRAEGDGLAVRTAVPPLTQHQRRRLPRSHPLFLRPVEVG